MAEIVRCSWCEKDDLYRNYHDEEWGVPEYDDYKLYEKFCLEAAQAGLSWYTVLKKRENYRKAFDHFDFEKVANYDENKIKELLSNEGIIRNKLKIHAAINNAQKVIEIRKEFGSFSSFIWQFVKGEPIVNQWKSSSEVPATTSLSDAMSKEMKKRGFKFVGSTICYAYMQAMGMINDHLIDCWKYSKLEK